MSGAGEDAGGTVGAQQDELLPRRVSIVLLGALVALGLFARIDFYLQARSFWQDEAVMALNVLTRPLTALLSGPLEFLQTAPPSFLVWEWAQAHTVGASELSLRFPSLVAGLLTPFVAWWAARPLLGPIGRFVAVGLVAVGPYLVGYSAELKPYAFDALFALACLGVVVRVVERGLSPKWLLAVGVAGVTLSVSIPFVLAPAWLAVVIHAAVRSDRALVRELLLYAVAWGALFLVVYLPVYRPTASDADMLAFWDEGFLRGPIREQFLLHRNWIVSALFHDAFVPGRFGVSVSILIMAGVAALALRRGPWAAVAVAGPLAAGYLASAAGRYPVEARLMLFAAPGVAFTVAAGVAGLGRLLRQRAWRAAWAAVGLALLLPGVLAVFTDSIRSEYQGEMRLVLDDPELAARPSEPIYVFSKAMPSWIYYTTDWSEPDWEQVGALKAAAMAIGPNSGNAPPRSGPVVGEGRDLLFTTGERPTLVGVASGFQAIYRRDWAYLPTVDQGWAANEVDRLAERPGRCFWLVFTHFKPEESGALEAELAARGMTLEHHRLEPGALLARYCEPAEPGISDPPPEASGSHATAPRTRRRRARARAHRTTGAETPRVRPGRR